MVWLHTKQAYDATAHLGSVHQPRRLLAETLGHDGFVVTAALGGAEFDRERVMAALAVAEDFEEFLRHTG